MASGRDDAVTEEEDDDSDQDLPSDLARRFSEGTLTPPDSAERRMSAQIPRTVSLRDISSIIEEEDEEE